MSNHRNLSRAGAALFSAGAESFYLWLFCLCVLGGFFGCAALDAGVQWSHGKTAALVLCGAIGLCAFILWIAAASERRA